jgi:hypothetical protein
LDWAANVSLMLTSFARQGVRQGAAPPSFVSVSASLTRYDSGTGTALFRGTIPFQPGVITSAGDLNTVRVLVDGYEPSGGLWIELLEPKHAGGASYKVAYVEFDAACGSAETVSCEVRIGQARATADRGSVTDAVERAPITWCRAMTLFWVTDPVYRVACRQTTLPLITMAQAQATLSQSWIDALTTGISSRWPTTGGSASYNLPYAICCLSEMTGDPSWMESAIRGFVPASGGGSGASLDYYTPNTGYYNPELRLAGNYTTNTFGIAAEWYDATPTMYLMYLHTGAKQIFNALELQAANGRPVRFSTGYSQRYNVRWFFSTAIGGRLLEARRVIQSLGGGWTYNPATLSDVDVVEDSIDTFVTNAATLTVANGIPAWAEGYSLWGLHANGWNANENPLFQISQTLWSLVSAYMNVVPDSRIPDALESMREFHDQQMREHTITEDGGYTAYCTSYFPIDPDDVLTDANLFFLTSMMAPLYAWCYARDNSDADAALKADRLVSPKMFNRDKTDGGGGMGANQKTVGEWFGMTPHAAAWRAGVPWNGWEVTP